MDFFQEYSGIDPSLFLLEEQDNLLRLFEAAGKHYERRPTSYLKFLHLNFYRDGLLALKEGNCPENSTAAKFILMSDILNPFGSETLEKRIGEFVRNSRSPFPESLSTWYTSLPLDVQREFQNSFIRRVLALAAEKNISFSVSHDLDTLLQILPRHIQFLVQNFRKPFCQIPTEINIFFTRHGLSDERTEIKIEEIPLDLEMQSYLKGRKLDIYLQKEILLRTFFLQLLFRNYSEERIQKLLTSFEITTPQIVRFLQGNQEWVFRILEKLN